MLNVSGPFHSGMLTGAGEKLGKVLEHVEIHEPSIPYVANVTAQYVTSAEPVKELLVKQVSSSVRWQQSVEAMIADGGGHIYRDWSGKDPGRIYAQDQ